MKLQEKLSLKGKVALVTGGAGLLGPQFAEALSEFGAKVILLDIDDKKGAKAVRQISKAFRSRVCFRQLDISNPAAVQGMVQETVRKYRRIDILINAAIGVGKNHFGPVENYSWEDWNDVMKVTVGGTFLCTREVGKIMKKQGRGSIINIGSIYGVVGADQRIYGKSGINSPAVYAASKGAIISMTRYFAVYWAASGIRVNSLSPGGVWNRQDPSFVERYVSKAPLGRMLEREELRGAVLFLASDASSYVTGHNLMVDGGWTAW